MFQCLGTFTPWHECCGTGIVLNCLRLASLDSASRRIATCSNSFQSQESMKAYESKEYQQTFPLRSFLDLLRTVAQRPWPGSPRTHPRPLPRHVTRAAETANTCGLSTQQGINKFKPVSDCKSTACWAKQGIVVARLIPILTNPPPSATQ